MAARSRTRQRLLQAHRWTGICVGLPLMVVAVTGAGLAFRAQLEPQLSPVLLANAPCTSPLALDTLVGHARAANPGAGPLRAVRLVGEPGAPVKIRFDDARWVYVSPCSGAVNGIQGLYGGPFGTLAYLHIAEYSPNGNLVAGGLAALLAIVLAGAGAWMWRRPTRTAVRFTSSGRHQAIALCAGPVLVLSAVTGMAQAFKWGAMPPAPAPASISAAASLPLAQLVAPALASTPGFQKVQIRLPAKAGLPTVLEVVERDAAHANAVTYIQLDPISGKVLLHMPYAANSLPHQAYLLAAAVHYGWAGGWPVRLLLVFGTLSLPLLAWTGVASYVRRPRKPRLLSLRVASKTIEGTGACAFELVDPHGRALPPFSAGAHLDIHLGQGLVRQYSLCNDPNETHRYQICVLKTMDSRGGSRAMHERVQQGGQVTVSVPRNHFPLERQARRSLLFAGGIGITPILAMAEHLERGGADFALHYCARSSNHAAFRDRIAAAPFADKACFHYSDGGQHPDLAALIGAPEEGLHLYVCGPAGFMQAVFNTALAKGWNESQLHREYFGGVPGTGQDQAFEVRVASTGKIIHIASGTSVVEALGEHGIEIPTACGMGLCGTCVTGVLDGEPDHRDRVLGADQHKRNDCFTPCCSRARSPMLTLDL